MYARYINRQQGHADTDDDDDNDESFIEWKNETMINRRLGNVAGNASEGHILGVSE